MERPAKKTNEDHSFGVQRRGVSKKDLTEPTLLEITDYATKLLLDSSRLKKLANGMETYNSWYIILGLGAFVVLGYLVAPFLFQI